MYIHWVMLHLWEGTPARPKGKKVDGASISGSFFHRWSGRPTPFSCSFATSSAEQQAKSKRQRPGWRGRKLGVPAAGVGGSRSALEAPAGARGHRARHRSSLLGREWSARPRAQERRFRGGAGGRPRGRELRALAFWPQCEAQASRRPEPGQLARTGVHPARMRGRRGS